MKQRPKLIKTISAFVVAFAVIAGLSSLYQQASAQRKTGVTRLSRSSFQLDDDVTFVKLSKGSGEVRRKTVRVSALTCRCSIGENVECNLTRDGKTILCASACGENNSCDGSESAF